MALVVVNSLGEQVTLNNSTFIEVQNEFHLSFGADDIVLSCPLMLSNEFNPENFSIFLFANVSLNAENDIFQVYEKSIDKRIGWIFPIQSLLSKDHEESSNPFYLNYAYVAYNLLITNQIDNFKSPPITTNLHGNCTLLDFYSEDSIVFIVSNAVVAELDNFNIFNYLPSFSNFGYFLLSNKSSEIIEGSIRIASYYDIYRGKTKISIKCIANKYIANPFIEELFKTLLFSSRHHLIIFHYLYQVIEYLIDETFKEEFDMLLAKYQENSISRLDFREELSTSLNEKRRLKKINDFIQPDGQICNDLLNECNRLLALIDNVKTSHVDAIYKVRSLIVHEYRRIASDPELIEIVENVNLRFEHLIVEVLTSNR